MDTLKGHMESAKRLYDAGKLALDEVGILSAYCVAKLQEDAKHRPQATLANGRKYDVFFVKNVSRPYRPDLYIASPAQFRTAWKALIGSADPAHNRYTSATADITRVLYTAITAASACFDVWKPGSRKTPGTIFEIVMGSVIGAVLPRHKRQKFIQIPGEPESVSTDIVFDSEGGPGLVFPAKITTRERIVQPFAHQRILDSVFGRGRYSSFLLCVSELQRDEDDNVNEICVPGTIRLFQKHLAGLSALYYLDPPTRYLQSDVTSVVPVKQMGELLATDLRALVGLPRAAIASGKSP